MESGAMRRRATMAILIKTYSGPVWPIILAGQSPSPVGSKKVMGRVYEEVKWGHEQDTKSCESVCLIRTRRRRRKTRFW